LTPQEEKALAAWISASAAVGNPVQHDFIREMAEHLIKQCIGDDEIIPQLGDSWVPSFLTISYRMQTLCMLTNMLAYVGAICVRAICAIILRMQTPPHVGAQFPNQVVRKNKCEELCRRYHHHY